MTPKAARYDQVKAAIEKLNESLSLPQVSCASISVLTAIAQEIAQDFADDGWHVTVAKTTRTDDGTVVDVIVTHPDYTTQEAIEQHAEQLLKLQEMKDDTTEND